MRPAGRGEPRLVTGLDWDAVALVFATHHVMADGMSGMALLRGLSDLPRPFAEGVSLTTQ